MLHVVLVLFTRKQDVFFREEAEAFTPLLGPCRKLGALHLPACLVLFDLVLTACEGDWASWPTYPAGPDHLFWNRSSPITDNKQGRTWDLAWHGFPKVQRKRMRVIMVIFSGQGEEESLMRTRHTWELMLSKPRLLPPPPSIHSIFKTMHSSMDC